MERKQFEIRINNPNDIIRVLSEADFHKYIVLEDFHYLSQDVQESISYDLKAFYDNSPYIFIIIGVWLESNRLLLYNGDLSGRINTISADSWKTNQLYDVIKAGEALLNIRFGDGVAKEIVLQSRRNVGLLQEIAYRLCEGYGVWRTQDEYKIIGSRIDVRAVLNDIAEEQRPRFKNFIVQFSKGLTETKHQLYKWIMLFVLDSSIEDIVHGLHVDKIYCYINESHKNKYSIQRNAVVHALENIYKVQDKHKVQPLIFNYASETLKVVDSNFLVFLSMQYKNELRDLLN